MGLGSCAAQVGCGACSQRRLCRGWWLRETEEVPWLDHGPVSDGVAEGKGRGPACDSWAHGCPWEQQCLVIGVYQAENSGAVLRWAPCRKHYQERQSCEPALDPWAFSYAVLHCSVLGGVWREQKHWEGGASRAKHVVSLGWALSSGGYGFRASLSVAKKPGWGSLGSGLLGPQARSL